MKIDRETRDTGTRIVDCAEALFAQKGYDGTSTRELARAAGVSIQTLHYHGKGKLGLYNQVLERSVIPVTNMINRHVQEMLGLDLADSRVLNHALARLIDELFDVLYANPHFPLLFFRQWLEQDPERRRVEWERVAPYLGAWTGQVEARVNQERLSGIDLPLAFISLSMVYWGLTSNPAFIGGVLALDPESPEYLERLKDHAKQMTSRLLGRGDPPKPKRKAKNVKRSEGPKPGPGARGKKPARKNPRA